MLKGFQFRRLYCGIRRSTALCITQHHTLDACFSFLLDILLEFSCQYFCTRHTPSFSLLNERPGDLFLPEVLGLVLAAFDRDIHWSGASPILIENQPADGFTGGSSVDVRTLKYTCCKQQHWTQTKRCTYTTFVTADRLYGKIEVDLLDQLLPYFRVKVGDMRLFDLDISSILYSLDNSSGSFGKTFVDKNATSLLSCHFVKRRLPLWRTTVSPGWWSLFLAHGGKSLCVHWTVEQVYVCWSNKCSERMGLEKKLSKDTWWFRFKKGRAMFMTTSYPRPWIRLFCPSLSR